MSNPNPNLNPILPIAGVSDQLIQVLNDRFREIRLQPVAATTAATANSTGSTPLQRTLLLKDTTIGNDIADHVTCLGPSTTHTVTLVRAVLRKAIASNLTVRINSVSANGVTHQVVGTFTIPSSTAVDSIVDFTSFTTSTLQDKSVFTWDVTASDGSKDSAGIASFTVIWEP